jgi:outer membrane protein assembly factor BamB
MECLAALPQQSNESGIIPQHIVAQSHATYVLLLFLGLCLGLCPEAIAAQRDNTHKPLPAPLLPVEEAWSALLPAPASAAGVMDDERVYIPLQSGQIVALNRETGVTTWSIDLKSAWVPAISGGVLYAATTNELIALQAVSGEPLWRVSLDGELMIAPALQGTSIVLLLKPDQLRALRLSDGTESWKHVISAPSDSPTMAGDAAGVVVASGNRVSRFASSDGRLVWERELGGVLNWPAISGDRIFVGSTDNYLYALDTNTGRLLWRYGAGGDVVGATADDRLVYFASLDNLLRALRRGNGNQVWKRDLATRTIAPPSTLGGIVLVSGNNPALAAFNAATGEPADKFELAGDVQGIPLVDNTLVPFRVAMVVITRDGRAIGLRPTRLMFREPALVPLQALPGRLLTREPFALPTSQPN